MQRIEIIFKDVISPRLTVAKDRITIKIPFDYDDKYDLETVINEFLETASEIGVPRNTFRGRLSENDTNLCMSTKRRRVNYIRKLSLEETTQFWHKDGIVRDPFNPNVILGHIYRNGVLEKTNGKYVHTAFVLNNKK